MMENKNIEDLLKNQKFSFKPNFSERVIFQLENVKENIHSSFDQMLNYIFPKVAIGSLAVMAIFFINIYLTQGTIDLESLTGIQEANQEYFYSDYFESF